MSTAEELIDNAKRIRQRLRNPPNAVYDPGINLTRISTACRGDGPHPDAPPKKILRDPEPFQIVPHQEIKLPLTFDDIVSAVAIHYGVSAAAIKGPSRRSPTVYARYVVIYLSIRLLVKRTLSSIARDLNKDHTTILAARSRINGIFAGNPQMAAEVEMLERRIEAIHNDRFAVSSERQSGVEIGWEASLSQ